MAARRRDRRPDEPTFRFDRVLLGMRITRRSGTRSWRQFEQDNAILSELAENGQAETLRLFQRGQAHGGLDMPALRAAHARGLLASGTLVADLALKEPLWGTAGAFRRILPRMGKGRATRLRYETSMAALERKAGAWLGPKATVADLLAVPWATLAEQWGASGSDWNHLRRMLSRFSTLLLDDKWHPFRRKLLKDFPQMGEVERVPEMTAEDFWRVVAKAPDYVRPAFVTLVATGMRWGEYARAKKSHLSRSTLGVRIPSAPGQRTKTAASAATVYVAEWLWPWIEAGVPAPLGYQHTRKHWRRACEAAGVSDVRLHDLRHLTGQLAIDAVDISKVADGLRHTQLATTRRYVRQRNRKDVARAVGDALKPRTAGEPPTSPHRRVSGGGA